MNHPHDDELLLLVYGELAPAESARLEKHLAQCDACRAGLAKLDAGQAALALALPPRRRHAVRWLAGGLAAAAVLAAVLIAGTGPDPNETPPWTPPVIWSATAGYIAGGAAVVEIDAQLTRLEQEKRYGFPN